MEFLSNLIKDLFWVVISNVIILLIIFVPIILAMITNNHAKNNIKTEQKARGRKEFYRACFVIVLILIIIVIIRFIIVFNRPAIPANTMINYSNQEKEAFNNTYETYKGMQTGANVRSLITRVISNTNDYKYEPYMVPSIVFFKEKDELGKEVIFDSKVSYENSEQINEFVKEVASLRNRIYTQNKYYVKCEKNSEDGLIDTIIIVRVPIQSNYSSEEVENQMEQFIENNRNYIKGE